MSVPLATCFSPTTSLTIAGLLALGVGLAYLLVRRSIRWMSDEYADLYGVDRDHAEIVQLTGGWLVVACCIGMGIFVAVLGFTC